MGCAEGCIPGHGNTDTRGTDSPSAGFGITGGLLRPWVGILLHPCGRDDTRSRWLQPHSSRPRAQEITPKISVEQVVDVVTIDPHVAAHCGL